MKHPKRRQGYGPRPAARLGVAIVLALAAAVAASAQSQTWNTFLGSAGWDSGRGAAVAPNGDVYVVGTSDGTWGAPVRAFSGKNDTFVAKLDRTGRILWTAFLGGTGNDNGAAVALDPRGGIYVAGTSDASWGAPLKAFGGATDAYAAKLDEGGRLLWMTFLGGPGSDQAGGIAADSEGGLRVLGSSTSTWGLPEGEYWSGSDAFAARLGPEGTLVWNTFLGGNGEDYGRGIVLGGDGEIFAVGTSTSTWGGSPVRGYVSESDAWAAKVDFAGHLIWNTFIGGTGYDSGAGIDVDPAGFAYLTGASDTTWGTPVKEHAGGYDAFAAKLDPDGTLVWNTFIGGDGKNFGTNIFHAPNGYLTVVGYGLGTWETPISAYTGGYDVFLCKLDNDGNFDWLTFVGGAGDDFAEAAAKSPAMDVCVVGVSDADWGAPARAFSENYDAFVAWVPETPPGKETAGSGQSAKRIRR